METLPAHERVRSHQNKSKTKISFFSLRIMLVRWKNIECLSNNAWEKEKKTRKKYHKRIEKMTKKLFTIRNVVTVLTNAISTLSLSHTPLGRQHIRRTLKYEILESKPANTITATTNTEKTESPAQMKFFVLLTMFPLEIVCAPLVEFYQILYSYKSAIQMVTFGLICIHKCLA